MRPPPESARHRVRRAMTLVEVLAVIVILGLLTAVLSVGITGKLARAKRELARTQVAHLAAQVQTFHLETNRLPKDLSELAGDPASSYFTEAERLIDPWGNAFVYRVPGGAKRAFEIVSLGADGVAGGSDADEDVSSAGRPR